MAAFQSTIPTTAPPSVASTTTTQPALRSPPPRRQATEATAAGQDAMPAASGEPNSLHKDSLRPRLPQGQPVASEGAPPPSLTPPMPGNVAVLPSPARVSGPTPKLAGVPVEGPDVTLGPPAGRRRVPESKPLAPGRVRHSYGAVAQKPPPSVYTLTTEPAGFLSAAPAKLVYKPVDPLSAPPVKPTREPSLSESIAPYICEFIGTFILVFTAATVAYTDSKQWSATAVGCVIVVLTYSVAFVSGGHLNPAVSLAAVLAGKMQISKFVLYVIVQLLAGILGGLFFELVFLTANSGAGPVAPFTLAQAAIVEVLYTALLGFVWLNVLQSKRSHPENDHNHFFGLAVGFAVMAAGYAGGAVSGAVLNPAQALGLAFPSWWRHGGLPWGAWYALVELGGGVVAALLFRMCRSEEYAFPLALDGYTPSLIVRLLSEYVGTFFLTLTFGLAAILLSPATAWAVGAALLCLVYALGNVSGGHFNPAVTAAVVMSGRGKCSLKDGGAYVLVQLVGGITAGILLWYMHSQGPTAHIEFGVNLWTRRYHWATVMVMEIAFTFLLAYVVLVVATSDTNTPNITRSRQNFYFALAVGLAMCVGVAAAGEVSGGFMNPAVALGFSVEAFPTLHARPTVKHWPAWGDAVLRGLLLVCEFFLYFAPWLAFFFYELIGATMAVGVFRLTYPGEYEKPEMLLVL